MPSSHEVLPDFKSSARSRGQFAALTAGLLIVLAVSLLPGSVQTASASSGLQLIGTVQGGPFTGAVLKDGTGGEQTFFRLNQKLPDGSRLLTVRSNHIVLKAPDGTLSELYITAGTGGEASARLPVGTVLGGPAGGTPPPVIAPADRRPSWQGQNSFISSGEDVDPPLSSIAAPDESGDGGLTEQEHKLRKRRSGQIGSEEE